MTGTSAQTTYDANADLPLAILKNPHFEGGPRFRGGGGGPLKKVPRFHLYELRKKTLSSRFPHVWATYVQTYVS